MNEKFEQIAIEFISCAEKYSFYMLNLNSEYEDVIFNEKSELNSDENILHMTIKNRIVDIYEAYIKLRFILRNVVDESDCQEKVIEQLEHLVTNSNELHFDLVKHREKLTDKIIQFKKEIIKTEIMLNMLLKNNTILNIDGLDNKGE